MKTDKDKNEDKKGKGNAHPTVLELFLVFLKVGAFTIGGGYAMLPLIQEEIVHKRRWMNTEEFLETLGITQSLPGPMAINFALLAGYKLGGIRAGLFSLFGAILPSFLIIMITAIYLWQYRDNAITQAAFKGIRPVVVALIIFAAIRLGKEMIGNRRGLILFLFFLGVLLNLRAHPAVIIAAGALTGFLKPSLGKKAGGGPHK